MKKIGIDARLYFQTGVGVYTRNLLHYLQKMNTDNITFYIYVMKEDAGKITFTKSNFIKREVTARWHTFSEQLSFLKELNIDTLDLMHFTYFSHPVLYHRPFIATVHDTILFQHKTGKASTLFSGIYNVKYTAFRYAFHHQVAASKRIVTPTETVKNQIIKLMGEKYSDKITSIHEGINYEMMEKKESSTMKNTVSSNYFLYVGNFYPHKNVECLLQAFSQIESSTKLVLVGPKDYFFKRIESTVNNLDIQNKVILCPNASDEDLIYLYKHAEALIHPSLSEGFGLPVIEAAYFGTPVIASNIPVFKEILGESYIRFDPYDVTDMRKKIEDFMKNKKKTSYKLDLDDFSFETMTKKLLTIYEKT